MLVSKPKWPIYQLQLPISQCLGVWEAKVRASKIKNPELEFVFILFALSRRSNTTISKPQPHLDHFLHLKTFIIMFPAPGTQTLRFRKPTNEASQAAEASEKLKTGSGKQVIKPTLIREQLNRFVIDFYLFKYSHNQSLTVTFVSLSLGMFFRPSSSRFDTYITALDYLGHLNYLWLSDYSFSSGSVVQCTLQSQIVMRVSEFEIWYANLSSRE